VGDRGRREGMRRRHGADFLKLRRDLRAFLM
jgi:hypothetical protein